MDDTGAAACWKLLELASIHDVFPVDLDVDSILPEVDWSFLMAAAMRHRLLPRVADFLLRSELMPFPPREYRRALVLALHDNRYRCAEATKEADRVVRALADRGVTVACTKGVGFQVSLYGGLGGRYFDDIDLMIHPEDKDQVAETVLGLGFQANLDHDFQADTLVSLPRQDVAMFRFYPDHLPHFLRPLTGYGFPYHTVDVCFNITWYGAGWQIPMSDVLADLAHVDVPGHDETITLPVLTAPYDFIFTATHLFREAWYERVIARKNIRLGLFADMWRQWHRLTPADVQDLATLVDKHAIAPPIAWVCHHVDQIFGSELVAGLGLDAYCDEAWLHSAGAMDGSCLKWTGSMRDRVRSADPPPLSPAAETRFAADARAARR